MSELVTGEAVALDLRPARLPSRAIAMVIDLAAQVAVLLAVVWLVSLAVPVDDGALAAALTLTIVVLVVIGWPVAWETASHGRSLGKLALGLRVVRDDGGPIRFRHALVRALLGFFVDFWTTFGCGAVFSSMASTNGKRLGDMAAGTFVVRERTPGVRRLPMPLHPAASAWATGIELSGLSDDLALAIRQYLSRRDELDPAIAASLAERLTVDTAQRIGIGPPPGMHPVVYLAAVLAERQRRDWERHASAAGGFAAGGATPSMAAPAPTSVPPIPPIPSAPGTQAPTPAPEPTPAPTPTPTPEPTPTPPGFTPPS
ncbi:RDD family protein [Embleya hyalina]|uniref:Transporter n=1 Tax=Embleya hyalina TaxID=516124 RepID=A0A401Z6S7_9ACTN|nr:RDD family protein [Embleya hyalina]GCE02570.1 transporter [Embleya hyalina]